MDAQIGEPAGECGGNRGPAETGGFHMAQMVIGEVGMIKQAGEEVRWAAPDGHTLALHQGQDLCGVPVIDEIDGRAIQHGNEECPEHADEVPDRGRRELATPVRRVVRMELAGLAANRLMAVDDALGIAGGTRRERNQRRIAGVGGERAGHRLVGEQVVETVLMLVA